MSSLGFVALLLRVQDSVRPEYATSSAVRTQYAARTTTHCGSALGWGVVLAALATRWRWKARGLLHPLLTLASIVATANHWVLDAAGGAVVIAAGFGITYLLQGPRARTVAAAGRERTPTRKHVHG
jgi:hypothetical protein